MDRVRLAGALLTASCLAGAAAAQTSDFKDYSDYEQKQVTPLPDADGRPAPADQPLSQNFRGEVTWRGEYHGQAVVSGGKGAQLDIGGLRANLPGNRSIPLNGEYRVRLEFNGAYVQGELRTTGALDPVTLTGTRQGSVCRLTSSDGSQSTAYCSARFYRERVDQVNAQRQRIIYTAQGVVAQLRNYALDERRQQEKMAAREQQAPAAKPITGGEATAQPAQLVMKRSATPTQSLTKDGHRLIIPSDNSQFRVEKAADETYAGEKYDKCKQRNRDFFDKSKPGTINFNADYDAWGKADTECFNKFTPAPLVRFTKVHISTNKADYTRDDLFHCITKQYFQARGQIYTVDPQANCENCLHLKELRSDFVSDEYRLYNACAIPIPVTISCANQKLRREVLSPFTKDSSREGRKVERCEVEIP